MTRPRSPRPRSASSPELGRSAKALPLSLDSDTPLVDLSARFEVQRRELYEAARAVAEARVRARRDQRQLGQLKARLQLAEERVAELEQEAASAYARAEERESRASAQLEQHLTASQEQRAVERADAAKEIASLRDALAAALERERTFRRLEADLRRRLAEPGTGADKNTWEPEDPRVTVTAGSDGAADDASHVP